jgi:hypothetical protein
MLYRPNFCCNCGEKIERVDWHLTVSRRFCDACSVENRRFDYLPRIAVAGGALALMFGLGSFWGVSGENRVSPTAFKSASQAQEPQKPLQVAERAIPPAHSSGEAIILPPPADIVSAKRKAVEAKFFCGALTKKGTPCSRKVKARGSRCYQHEGRPEAPPIN